MRTLRHREAQSLTQSHTEMFVQGEHGSQYSQGRVKWWEEWQGEQHRSKEQDLIPNVMGNSLAEFCLCLLPWQNYQQCSLSPSKVSQFEMHYSLYGHLGNSITDVNLEMPNLSRIFKQKNSEVWSCEKSGLEIDTWRSSAYLLQL